MLSAGSTAPLKDNRTLMNYNKLNKIVYIVHSDRYICSDILMDSIIRPWSLIAVVLDYDIKNEKLFSAL